MADDSRLSAVIDDDGQLFGLINVIDALVVLFVIAIIGAGIALVGVGGEPADTRYATIDLGEQPDYTANQITVGDEWDVQGSADVLTVTDVFLAPTADGDRNVVIRAEVNGTAIDPEAQEQSAITFAGEPLRFGRDLEIETPQYVVEGVVTDVGPEESFGTEATRSVTVEATEMPQSRVDRLGVGLTEVMRDDETATVTDVSDVASEEIRSSGDGFTTVEHPRNRDVTMTLDMTVRELDDGTVLFRGSSLRIDQSIVFEFDEVTFEGDVVAIE